jgi:cytochrome c biogenesis protein CcdA
MLAVAALTVNKPFNRIAAIVAAFTGGTLAAYSVLVLGGTLLWQAVRYSSYVYLGIATIMAIAGITALVRQPGCECGQSARSAGSLSSVFLLGATSVATFSPCCMPLVGAAVLYAQGTGLAFAWLIVMSFALGHAAPLALAAAGSRAAALAVYDRNARVAARVVTGALMLGGAGFYYVLA